MARPWRWAGGKPRRPSRARQMGWACTAPSRRPQARALAQRGWSRLVPAVSVGLGTGWEGRGDRLMRIRGCNPTKPFERVGIRLQRHFQTRRRPRIAVAAARVAACSRVQDAAGIHPSCAAATADGQTTGPASVADGGLSSGASLGRRRNAVRGKETAPAARGGGGSHATINQPPGAASLRPDEAPALGLGDAKDHPRAELIRVRADGGLVDLVDRRPLARIG